VGRYWVHSMPDDMRDDGQRPCARGDRCARATVTIEKGERIYHPALTYRAFCETCSEAVRNAIQELPGYYTELGERIGDHATGIGQRVSGSKDLPTPINLTFDELRTELVNTISAWGARVCETAKLSGHSIDWPTTRHTPDTLTRMCEILTAHLDALFSLPPAPMTITVPLAEADALPETAEVRRHYDAGYAVAIVELDGADAGLAMLKLASRCRWMLGHVGRPERLQGRCLHCDMVGALIRPDLSTGLADWAECGACGTRYTGVEYLNLVRALYEQEIQHQREAS